MLAQLKYGTRCMQAYTLHCCHLHHTHTHTFIPARVKIARWVGQEGEGIRTSWGVGQASSIGVRRQHSNVITLLVTLFLRDFSRRRPAHPTQGVAQAMHAEEMQMVANKHDRLQAYNIPWTGSSG
jgi:hypothetical protein